MCRNDILNLLEKLNNWLSDMSTDLLKAVWDHDHHQQRKDSERNNKDVSDITSHVVMHFVNLVRNYFLGDYKHKRIVFLFVKLIIFLLIEIYQVDTELI